MNNMNYDIVGSDFVYSIISRGATLILHVTNKTFYPSVVVANNDSVLQFDKTFMLILLPWKLAVF